MDRAAKEALKRYPDVKREDFEDEDEFFDCLADRNVRRIMWREGYRQADKDLALTWEDMSKIDAIILDVNNEFAVDYSKEISRQKFYEEVLRRFNERRKK